MKEADMTTSIAPAATAAAPAPTQREQGALAALLAGTGVLYLWNLSVNGWANDFYAMAVRSMTTDWKAFFFASLDAGNTVTVDKPPASLWIMALSGRIFGVNAWSMLVPQALMGVATVAVLYAAVRRVAGPRAGLIAGAAMALTPVAVLMFRFNNPDALLVLLMVAAAYATVRAIEKGGTRWLLLAGFLLGFGFLTKMLQAFVVLPALALAFLVAAPTGLWKRVWQLLAAGVAVVVGSGWWIAIAELWPAADRPYIGGSTTNSVLELALGYNGLGRIFGNERGGPGGPGFGGQPGVQRLFTGEIGGQATWLLPTAFFLLLAGLWISWRRREARGSLILWGGWIIVSFFVFSLAQGTVHPYYTVALAPGIAALVGIGGVLLWRERTTRCVRALLVALVVGTGVWSSALLGRSPEYLPWLCWVVLAAAALAAVGVLGATQARAVDAGTIAAVVFVGLAGPTAYTVTTVITSHVGNLPSAGPEITRTEDVFGSQEPLGNQEGARQGASGPPAQRGIPAGPVDPAVVSLLQAAHTDWSAAVVGSRNAAALALSSDTDVMAIGGFSGDDPAPSLQQFQAEVGAGRIHWFVGGSERGGGPGADSTAGRIDVWVQQQFGAQALGGMTFYDLTTPR